MSSKISSLFTCLLLFISYFLFLESFEAQLYVYKLLKTLLFYFQGFSLFSFFYFLGYLIKPIRFFIHVENRYSFFLRVFFGQALASLMMLLLLSLGMVWMLPIQFLTILSGAGSLFLIFRKLKNIVIPFEPGVTPIFWLGLTIISSLLIMLPSQSPIAWFDALNYHLGVPFFYIQQGQIDFFKGNVYANFPQNAEMLNTFCLLLNSEALCKFLTAGQIILSASFLARVVYHRSSNYSSAFLVYTLVCSSFLVFKQVEQANVDSYLLFGVSLFFVLLSENKVDESKNFFGLGLLAGILVGYKYTAIIFVLPFLFLKFISKFKNPKLDIKNFSYASLGFIVSFGPWIFKNYFLTGNPLYPFLSDIFVSRDWYPDLVLAFSKAHSPARGSSILEMLKPIFVNGDGFLWCLAIFSSWKNGFRISSLFILWSALSFAYLTQGNSRFLIPVLGIVYLHAVLSFKASKFSFLIQFLLSFGICLRLMAVIPVVVASLMTYLGFMSFEERIRELSDPYFKMCELLNNKHINQKVMLIGETRSYPLKIEFELSSPFNRLVLERFLKKSSSIDDLVRALKAEGFTRIVVNHLEIKRINKAYGKFYPAIVGASFEKNSKEFTLWKQFINWIQSNNELDSNMFAGINLVSL